MKAIAPLCGKVGICVRNQDLHKALQIAVYLMLMISQNSPSW